MARNLAGSLAGRRTFQSLRHRNFRLLWIGMMVSHSGDWMDQLALNWLVLELTGSPFYLGMVNLARAIPILLLTLLGGVAADRIERRRLMMMTQSFAMLLAFILAALVSTGRIQIWQIMAIAAFRGAMLSFNFPARQSLISDIVPREDLPNAVALNSMTMNLTRIIGPSLAGLLIGAIGVAGCFYINGVSFLAVLWTLYAMQIPPIKGKPQQASVLQSLTEGMRYVRGQAAISLLIAIALIPMFFGQPYLTMLAVFAKDVLAIGPAGLGVLTSASGIGAVTGALALASLSNSASRGTVMLGTMIAFGLLMILFSYSPWPPLSVLLIAMVGAANTGYNASNATLLQMAVPDRLRGRVMSTLFLNRGLVPLGTALAGTLAELFGVQLAMASMSAVIVLFGLLALAKAPSVRRL